MHPSDENDVHELFLMCDDVHALIAEMKQKKVKCSPSRRAALGIDNAAHAPRRRDTRHLPAKAPLAAVRPRRRRPVFSGRPTWRFSRGGLGSHRPPSAASA